MYNVVIAKQSNFLFIGSGRHYISLGSGGSEKKSPAASDNSSGQTGDSSNDGAATSSSRPQLRVVLPGQKGFVYRSVS